MIRRKILVVYISLSSFVEDDIEILSSRHTVRTLQWTSSREVAALARLVNRVLWSDLVYIWFAGAHAYRVSRIAKLLHRPVVIVATGYGVARVPEIGYGKMLDARGAPKIRWSLGNARVVLAGSAYNFRESEESGAGGHVELVYHAIDPQRFCPAPGVTREPIVLTVGILNESNLLRKGIEHFVAAAHYLPSTSFVVIGIDQDGSGARLRSGAPPNVLFTGHVSADELVQWYRRSSVYVQASAHEGFGVSLCEAMACGCTPVVTTRGALPEVAAETGYYVEYGDPASIASGVTKALRNPRGEAASHRARETFPMSRRRTEILECLDGRVFLPSGQRPGAHNGA